MEKEKIFIVGDIHGCLDPLKRLMEKIPWRPDRDRLIFLGDFVDRGKNAKGVVDYVLALRRCSSQIDCLVGNHEVLLLNYMDGNDRGLYFLNGGWSTLESYRAGNPEGKGSLVPEDHMSFFRSLKTYLELEDYYVVHAGFRPRVEIEKQTLEDMTWIREPFIYSGYDFGKRVIFGHTPFRQPLVLENKIGLDTGAVYGNRLTCLELPDLRFYSVKA
jgi:serine/threonine protein phosphatase 1